MMTTPAAPDVGQSADVDRTARTIKGDEPVRSPTLERRQGKIVAVDVVNSKIDVTLGGNSVVIPGVAHVSNYRPAVGDTVWVDVNGPDLLALDRVGSFGPSVIATAASASVDTEQTRTSESFGDLSTVGPSVTVDVSPSGRLLVQVSAYIFVYQPVGDNVHGGAVGVALSGANTLSPTDREAILYQVSTVGDHQSIFNASKVTLYSGLNAGSTTVRAKYRCTNLGDAEFSLRHIWALPL